MVDEAGESVKREYVAITSTRSMTNNTALKEED